MESTNWLTKKAKTDLTSSNGRIRQSQSLESKVTAFSLVLKFVNWKRNPINGTSSFLASIASNKLTRTTSPHTTKLPAFTGDRTSHGTMSLLHKVKAAQVTARTSPMSSFLGTVLTWLFSNKNSSSISLMQSMNSRQVRSDRNTRLRR